MEEKETIIDFFTELSNRNCQHIIENILTNLSPISILTSAKVSKSWNDILSTCRHYPHDLNNIFQRYLKKNPLPFQDIIEIKTPLIQKHKLYAGGEVKTALIQDDSLFLGLSNGLVKYWDLSNYDNLKHPPSKLFEPGSVYGEGVTQIAKADKYLATGHNRHLIIIWSLESAAILSKSITVDPSRMMICQIVLSGTCLKLVTKQLYGWPLYLRVYENCLESLNFKEYPLGNEYNDFRKRISLSSEAMIYSYQYQDEIPWFMTFKIGIIKFKNDDHHPDTANVEEFAVNKEVVAIFQDSPLVLLEMAYFGKSDIQLWDLDKCTPLYSVEILDFRLTFTGLSSWKYWCHQDNPRVQTTREQFPFTIGSILDLLEQNFQDRQVIDEEDGFFIVNLFDNGLIFFNHGTREVTIHELTYPEAEDRYLKAELL